ncbi:hypothetical protein C8039_12365 [Halogeometricum sp. wsp3]|nr:hypothetical protein C8039_12365 [Halogeometricum sp. wsp3]
MNASEFDDESGDSGKSFAEGRVGFLAVSAREISPPTLVTSVSTRWSPRRACRPTRGSKTLSAAVGNSRTVVDNVGLDDIVGLADRDEHRWLMISDSRNSVVSARCAYARQRCSRPSRSPQRRVLLRSSLFDSVLDEVPENRASGLVGVCYCAARERSVFGCLCSATQSTKCSISSR